MMHPNRDENDGVSVPTINPTDDKEALENRSDLMDVAIDSRSPTEGNENTFVGGLGSNEAKASRKGRKRKGDKTMKDQKEKVDSIRTCPSSTKNTQDDTFQVGSSSRVTPSQRRKQIELEMAIMESGLYPPNMGAQNTTSTHGIASGSSKRADMKREAANHETKANEHMPTMMDEGSSRKFFNDGRYPKFLFLLPFFFPFSSDDSYVIRVLFLPFRKRNARIMLKNSFSRFKNTASTPIVIGFDDDDEDALTARADIDIADAPTNSTVNAGEEEQKASDNEVVQGNKNNQRTN
ncbi:hypothetical protein L6452_02741 [Arctium lappa]|uniref:Uncharacterized protein n=1 Tax=Arctium lappa TaxID=4217 RepID=A0ACB9FKS4_ARCLA|nr:hypothetical protein L6452_02741 [Arctium lappa]